MLTLIYLTSTALILISVILTAMEIRTLMWLTRTRTPMEVMGIVLPIIMVIVAMGTTFTLIYLILTRVISALLLPFTMIPTMWIFLMLIQVIMTLMRT